MRLLPADGEDLGRQLSTNREECAALQRRVAAAVRFSLFVIFPPMLPTYAPKLGITP